MSDVAADDEPSSSSSGPELGDPGGPPGAALCFFLDGFGLPSSWPLGFNDGVDHDPMEASVGGETIPVIKDGCIQGCIPGIIIHGVWLPGKHGPVWMGWYSPGGVTPGIGATGLIWLIGGTWTLTFRSWHERWSKWNAMWKHSCWWSIDWGCCPWSRRKGHRR